MLRCDESAVDCERALFSRERWADETRAQQKQKSFVGRGEQPVPKQIVTSARLSACRGFDPKLGPPLDDSVSQSGQPRRNTSSRRKVSFGADISSGADISCGADETYLTRIAAPLRLGLSPGRVAGGIDNRCREVGFTRRRSERG
jgi:hypothetical protein